MGRGSSPSDQPGWRKNVFVEATQPIFRFDESVGAAHSCIHSSTRAFIEEPVVLPAVFKVVAAVKRRAPDVPMRIIAGFRIK
jgi:hypothetical protein